MSADAKSNQCYAFSESGSCRFGDKCHFDHGDQHKGVARKPRAPRDNTCYAFSQGGNCKFGDSCRFSHGGAGGASSSSASGARGGDSSFRPRRRPLASKSQLCFSFSESQSCQYGDNCRFAHGENDERDLNLLKRRAAGVCYNWKESGECKFGDGCRFAHENLPEKDNKE